ncbi:Ada metal-binding domain-containing protein [Pseudodesulfovibrio karagichevae]|uniref:Ada metal-binding domain-containing protein n=1 Tax=Pseudodesulfovibrio karagichevae TaxID=3239305 RepID=A0ABV4K5D4_9BACT
MRKLLACVLILLTLSVAATAASFTYHGNRDSHIFHRPGCRYYNCKHCVVNFASRQAALEAGYRPCKVCKP